MILNKWKNKDLLIWGNVGRYADSDKYKIGEQMFLYDKVVCEGIKTIFGIYSVVYGIGINHYCHSIRLKEVTHEEHDIFIKMNKSLQFEGCLRNSAVNYLWFDEPAIEFQETADKINMIIKKICDNRKQINLTEETK